LSDMLERQWNSLILHSGTKLTFSCAVSYVYRQQLVEGPGGSSREPGEHESGHVVCVAVKGTT
jgi:hypothetical protein